jgi:serine/threonine protein kinase
MQAVWRPAAFRRWLVNHDAVQLVSAIEPCVGAVCEWCGEALVPLEAATPHGAATLPPAATSGRGYDRSAASLGPGTELDGYRLGSLLGRGSVGAIWKATELCTGRTVALKVLADHLCGDAGFRARFEREAELGVSVEHPNLLPVHRVGGSGERHFIVMRLVAGPTLHQLHEQQGELEPQHAAWLLGQVAMALEALHADGIVHRAVKPADVMVDAAGALDHAYLIDLGMAKRVGQGGFDPRPPITPPGQFVGTSNYASPEQIRGDEVDGRTDVYHVGCTLYEALVGRPSYGGSEAAQLLAHASDPPPSPRASNTHVPAELDAIVLRATAKQPGDRFSSAREMARALISAAGLRFRANMR